MFKPSSKKFDPNSSGELIDLEVETYPPSEDKPSVPPFYTWIWRTITEFSGAIGLLNFASDLLKWNEIFVNLIEAYQICWYYLFSWINFQIPNGIKDYIFFGLITVSAFARVIVSDQIKAKKRSRDAGKKSERIYYERTELIYAENVSLVFVLSTLGNFIAYLVLWPIPLMMAIVEGSHSNTGGFEKRVVKSLIRILSMFISLMALNIGISSFS